MAGEEMANVGMADGECVVFIITIKMLLAR